MVKNGVFLHHKITVCASVQKQFFISIEHGRICTQPNQFFNWFRSRRTDHGGRSLKRTITGNRTDGNFTQYIFYRGGLNKMYDYSVNGAQSERAFIGALATALNAGDESITGATFETITDSGLIFAEPATGLIYDAYRKKYATGEKVTAAEPVIISGNRSEVRQIIDSCIKCFNEIGEDSTDGAGTETAPDYKEYLQRFINEYKKAELKTLYQSLARATESDDSTAAAKIETEIEKAKKTTNSAAERLNQYCAKNRMDFFKVRDPAQMRRPIPTGFKTLDKYTAGGLRDELYIITAGTSVGKTAFAMQIADHVAQSQPVIIFALEMGKDELIARSISRETFNYSKDNCGDGNKYGRSQLDILNFDRFGTNCETPFTAEEIAITNKATAKYDRYSNNIYIVPAIGKITINTIKDTVNDFKRIYASYNELQMREKNPRPIYPFVIIDYLQMMSPTDERQDEIRKTNEIVEGLKQISRDTRATIICLSATARSSYNAELDISSGKNSGGIEYTAGSVFGLQFYAQSIDVLGERITTQGTAKYLYDKSNADVKVERSREPRYMELTVLKNRSGIVQNQKDRIILEYHARCNHFAEISEDRQTIIKKKIQRDYADILADKLNITISDANAYGETRFTISGAAAAAKPEPADDNVKTGSKTPKITPDDFNF